MSRGGRGAEGAGRGEVWFMSGGGSDAEGRSFAEAEVCGGRGADTWEGGAGPDLIPPPVGATDRLGAGGGVQHLCREAVAEAAH